MGSKLYVGNLDFQTTSGDLTDLFTGAGHVVSAQVITDRATQLPKGFAFVEMANEAEALQAISLYNGHMLNTRPLQVSEARSREEQSRGGDLRGGTSAGPGPRFREVKHKARGGRKPRRF